MLRATLTVLTLFAFATAAEAAEAVRWTADYRQAAEIAARERKLILLHFESDDCPPCRKLAANVFSRDDVAQAIAADFIAVKINVARNPELARRYNVTSWPQDVIVTPMSQEVYRQVSPQAPADYIARLKETVARSSSAMARSNAALPPNGSAGATQPVGYQSPAPRGDTSSEYASPEIDNGAPTPGRDATPAVPQQNEYVASSSANNPPAAPSLGTDYEGIDPVVPPAAARPQNGPYSTPPPVASAPRSVPPVAQNKAPILPPLGMEGYCVVSLQHYNQKVAEAQAAGTDLDPALKGWVKGNKKFGAVHRGRLYLFANATAQKAFLADPDRFAPALSGYDPVVFNETQQLVEGKRAFGLTFNGQIYVFASEESLNRFEAEPKPFADTVYQAMLRSDQASKSKLR